MSKSPTGRYKELLAELHALMALGMSDSELADDVRDDMDGPWHDMTVTEQKEMCQLSMCAAQRSRDSRAENKYATDEDPDTNVVTGDDSADEPKNDEGEVDGPNSDL